MDFLQTQSNFSLFELLRYTETVNFVLGNSRSGKTSFMKKFILAQPEEQKLFLYDTSGKKLTNDLSEIKSVTTLSCDFRLNEECLETLPQESILIIDDFQLQTGYFEWQRVLNYCAHHYKLSIFLVVHSHFHTSGLHFALKNCSNIYLTYSNNSKTFLRSLWGGKFLSIFSLNWKQGVSKYHVAYINTTFSIFVNFLDCLLVNDTSLSNHIIMYDISECDTSRLVPVKEKKWYITDKIPESLGNLSNDSNLGNEKLEEYFSNELSKVYNSKIFPKMFKIVRCLLTKNVIGENELILNKINVIDFLAFTQRPENLKPKESLSYSSDDSHSKSQNNSSLGYLYTCKKKTKRRCNMDRVLLKVCKKLKKRGVMIPLSLIRNDKVKQIFI